MTTIQNTLRPFGITRCYKGFKYTVYAIHLVIENMETASYFGCKWTAVEHNIRTAVSKA